MSWNLRQKIEAAANRAVYWLSGDAFQDKVSKYLGFVFYVFVLLCGMIVWSLVAENDMVRIESNERVIEDLRINYQQKQLDFVGLNNRTRIDNLLEVHHSKLHAPTEPPKKIQLEK